VSANPLDQIRGLRIAHLIESDGPGGAERMVASLASELQVAGSQNVVIVPAKGEGWLAGELASTDVAIEAFSLDRPVSPTCARGLQTLFRRHRIAVAHSHEFTMAVYGAYASWRVGIGHLITMHGSRYYATRWRRRIALRAAVALSSRLVAVSTNLADALSRDLRIPRSRIATIPNGVRSLAGERRRLREELRLSPSDQLLLAVGNLYPVKGHQFLVEALALLRDRYPRAHVAIAGRGDLADLLLARAGELGLSDRVHVLGLRSDIPNLLAAADVFVLPSLSEGLPLALLEAMFASRPIVASDVGDVRSALKDGQAGVLVRPGDSEELARALDELLSNPDEARRLGEEAARRAARDYDVLGMAARYALIYRALSGDTTG